jgi:peptidoglycan L-alanyl-D-glutamate endopeptidase CwlK
MFSLSQRSLNNLRGVHPDLVRVVHRAIEITTVDFVVIEGVRTLARQEQLVKAGASRTLNSRHIPGKDGFGKAVDVMALVAGKGRWDWPLYPTIAQAFKAAATELSVPIVWGGDWPRFRDGPHFELSRKHYP